jgi:hypothetical protein
MLPVWLHLIFESRWRWTQRLAAFVMPLLLAAVYAALNILRPVKKLNVILQNHSATVISRRLQRIGKRVWSSGTRSGDLQ